MELWYLISAHYLMMLYVVSSFTKISQRVSDLLKGCGLYTEIFKGHYSVNSEGGVMVLVLSTFSKCFIFVSSFVEVSQRVLELRT